MAEPTTIGALVAGLLLAGGRLVADGALKEAGKAAVTALRDRLTRENGVTTLDLLDLLDRVEEAPALRGAVEQDIDASPAPRDADTLALVERLRAAIDALPREHLPAYAIEDSVIEAGRDLVARRVEGIRATTMTAGRDIDIGGVKAPKR